MKKFSKVFLSLALVLAMTIPMLTMTGCDFFNGSNEDNIAKTISRIELTDNVKTEYSLNEPFDEQNAKLRVVYSNESNMIINIVNSMITGFDTHTPNYNKTMTITYAEKTLSINYNVKFPFELGKYLPLNFDGETFHKITNPVEIDAYECFEFESSGVLKHFTSNISGNRLTEDVIGPYAYYETGNWSYSEGIIIVSYNDSEHYFYIENNMRIYTNISTAAGTYRENFGKI